MLARWLDLLLALLAVTWWREGAVRDALVA